MRQVEEDNQPARGRGTTPRWRLVLTAVVVLAIIAAAGVIIALALAASRTGTRDPSLADRMGSQALKFPIQLAYVFTGAAAFAGFGLIRGRRVIEVQVLASAVLVGISTALFYGWDIDNCPLRLQDAFDLSITGAGVFLAWILGFISGRRGLDWVEHAGATLTILATLSLLAHVQMWHCAGPSQQQGRELIAPFAVAMIAGAPALAGSSAAWWFARRARRKWSGPSQS
jgi:hypothetical protein